MNTHLPVNRVFEPFRDGLVCQRRAKITGRNKLINAGVPVGVGIGVDGGARLTVGAYSDKVHSETRESDAADGVGDASPAELAAQACARRAGFQCKINTYMYTFTCNKTAFNVVNV